MGTLRLPLLLLAGLLHGGTPHLVSRDAATLLGGESAAALGAEAHRLAREAFDGVRLAQEQYHRQRNRHDRLATKEELVHAEAQVRASESELKAKQDAYSKLNLCLSLATKAHPHSEGLDEGRWSKYDCEAHVRGTAEAAAERSHPASVPPPPAPPPTTAQLYMDARQLRCASAECESDKLQRMAAAALALADDDTNPHAV